MSVVLPPGPKAIAGFPLPASDAATSASKDTALAKDASSSPTTNTMVISVRSSSSGSPKSLVGVAGPSSSAVCGSAHGSLYNSSISAPSHSNTSTTSKTSTNIFTGNQTPSMASASPQSAAAGGALASLASDALAHTVRDLADALQDLPYAGALLSTVRVFFVRAQQVRHWQRLLQHVAQQVSAAAGGLAAALHGAAGAAPEGVCGPEGVEELRQAVQAASELLLPFTDHAWLVLAAAAPRLDERVSAVRQRLRACRGGLTAAAAAQRSAAEGGGGGGGGSSAPAAAAAAQAAAEKEGAEEEAYQAEARALAALALQLRTVLRECGVPAEELEAADAGASAPTPAGAGDAVNSDGRTGSLGGGGLDCAVGGAGALVPTPAAAPLLARLRHLLLAGRARRSIDVPSVDAVQSHVHPSGSRSVRHPALLYERDQLDSPRRASTTAVGPVALAALPPVTAGSEHGAPRAPGGFGVGALETIRKLTGMDDSEIADSVTEALELLEAREAAARAAAAGRADPRVTPATVAATPLLQLRPRKGMRPKHLYALPPLPPVSEMLLRGPGGGGGGGTAAGGSVVVVAEPPPAPVECMAWAPVRHGGPGTGLRAGCRCPNAPRLRVAVDEHLGFFFMCALHKGHFDGYTVRQVVEV